MKRVYNITKSTSGDIEARDKFLNKLGAKYPRLLIHQTQESKTLYQIPTNMTSDEVDTKLIKSLNDEFDAYIPSLPHSPTIWVYKRKNKYMPLGIKGLIYIFLSIGIWLLIIVLKTYYGVILI
jgi:hypothetical protein